MRITTLIRQPEGRVLFWLLLATPFLLTPWVHGDGIGHFVFLHSAILDGDLSLGNEYDYVTQHIIEDAGGLPGHLLRYSAHRPGYHPGYHKPPPDPVTGRIPSNWSIGPAILWTPAYVVAHGISLAAHAAGLPVRTDGYGDLYYWALALATFGYGVAGLLIALRIASQLFAERDALWATLTIAAASPLLYYLYMAPSHSHGLTVFTAGLFLWVWLRTRDRATSRTHFVWGLLAGLMFLVRWNDAVLLLPVLIAEWLRLWRTASGSASSARRRAIAACVRCGVWVTVGFALVSLPQFAVWQYFHGRPWIRHSVDTLQITPAGLWGTLFSWNHGLFTWTPVVLLAVLGLWPLWRRDRRLAAVALGMFAALIASNCTVYDWWAGTAFGQRRMISGTPVYVLGLAGFLAWAGDAWRRRGHAQRARLAAPVILAVFGAWNVLLLMQFSLGMISHTEAVPFSVMASNQPKVIARLIELAGQMLR